MQSITDFFDQPFFIIAWGISTLIVIIGILYTLYLVFKGIISVWYRLWLALSKRKIAVFADDKFNELKNLLIDSNIFNEKNIVKIEKSEIKKAKSISLFLIHWSSFKENIDEILSEKNHSDAIIIYAPQDEGFIEKTQIEKLNLQSNCTIVNFRGRLLNDILTSMITTSYEKR